MIELTEEQVASLLVGRPVEVSVGEPWNFTSPDGENVLKGTIVEAAGNDEGDPRSQQVTLKVTPFVGKGGRKIDHLRAERRYREPAGIIEHLASGEWAEVNLSYEDQVHKGELAPGSSAFLIGGMRLA